LVIAQVQPQAVFQLDFARKSTGEKTFFYPQHEQRKDETGQNYPDGTSTPTPGGRHFVRYWVRWVLPLAANEFRRSFVNWLSLFRRF
jgi:hypothetical protein